VFVAVVMSYPATAGLSFAVSAAVGLGGLAAWQRLRSRHARIGGTVVFPSPWARAARSAAVVVTVAIAAVLGPLAALAVAAPA
jgi:NADPH:quinone reductase-like Zn-dependent oxidoreductase